MPIPSKASDVQIATLVRGGDRDAIVMLVERFSSRLFRYLNHLLRDASLAEDVVQETWLRVMERIDRYNPPHSFKAWLFAVAHNCAIDIMRRRSREGRSIDFDEEEGNDRPALVERVTDTTPSVLSGLEERQLQLQVDKLFSNLPSLYREVLALRFHEEMLLEEIAQVLKLPLSTVKTRVWRGLELLRQRILVSEFGSHE